MSSSQLPTNFSTILQRWPQLFESLMQPDIAQINCEVIEQTIVVDGIQLTSNYNRQAEAALQINRIPLSASEAFVYGPALGDAIEQLLKRKTIRKLYVLILNKAVFIQALQAIEAMSWLSDPRVQLLEANQLEDVRQPFCANPAELTLADDDNEAMADWVQLELNHAFILEQHQSRQQQQLAHIDKNIDYVIQDKDIAQLVSPKVSQIFVAAAGPTLNQHIDYLKTHKPFLIAVDASVRVLLSHDIIPDIVVSIDYTAFQFFNDIPPERLSNTALVYFPNVQHEVLDYWPGPRYCSYSQTEMYKDISTQATKTPLFCAGSVVHPAIDLAVYLQATDIILLGTDFAFSFNQSHAKNLDQSPASHELALENAQDSVLNGLGERVATMTSLKGYLRELERYIRRHPKITFLNGSQHSAKIQGAQLWQR